MNASQNKLLVLGFVISMFGTSGCIAVGALDRAAVSGSDNNLQGADGGGDEGGDDEVVAPLAGDEPKESEKAPAYPVVGVVSASCSTCKSEDMESATVGFEIYAGKCEDVSEGKSEVLASAKASMSCTSTVVGKFTVTSCSATAGDFEDASKARVTELEVAGGSVCYRASVDKQSGMADHTLVDDSGKETLDISIEGELEAELKPVSK
jgi:hypothetical protein